MTENFEINLANYFMRILDGEKSVERLRQTLARKDNFHLQTAFNRLDRDSKNFISLNDLKTFLTESNLVYTDFNSREIIRHFDRDRDFVINYEEFCNLILTKEDSSLRSFLTERRESSTEQNKNLSVEIEFALSRIFERELQLINEFFEIASEIKHFNFNVYKAFRVIDHLNSNTLDQYNISNYLSRNGFNLNTNDLKSLISRLDRDWDGKISYEEFKEIFYLTIQSNPSKKISESNNNNSDFINKQSILLTENQQQNNEQNQNNLNSNIQDKPEEMKKTINSQFSSSGFIKNSPTIDLFNKTNLSSSKINNFATTFSTLKEYTSPLRETAFQNLNLRASMNTYSPNGRANLSEFVNNHSQTQPRAVMKSPNLPNDHLTRKLNYDYNLKISDLIRSVDRAKQTKSSTANQSRFALNTTNSTLNYSATHLNNSKEGFFKQTNQSNPEPIAVENKTYTSLRLENSRITQIPQDRENRSTINKGLTDSNTLTNNYSVLGRNDNKFEIESALFKFLNDIMLIETNIETIKESLSLKTDVLLTKIFPCFDLSGKGSVSVKDFVETLNNSLEIFSNIEEIKLLFKRFDLDLDCRLNFNEFCELLTPKKLEYARLINERNNYHYDMDITYESKLILTKLFRTLIEGENLIENNRKLLTSRKFFSCYDAFDSIKDRYHNFISKENVDFFLKKHSKLYSQFELDLLFHRFDKNRDNRITFNKVFRILNQFIQEVLPKSYNSY